MFTSRAAVGFPDLEQRMKTQAALVGTGSWARSAHVPALRAAGVDIVACVSGSHREASSAADDLSIPHAFGDLEAMLESGLDVSMIVIAAPDAVHPVAARLALENGVAVFCEKPIANEATTASDLAQLASRSGIPATVGYSFRYSESLQMLRQHIREGRFGTPWLVELWEHNPQFHPRTGKSMNWKGDPRHSAAGALFEYGSHAVDLAEWLLGPATSVATNFGLFLPEAKLDDVATLQLSFQSGCLGTLVASWLLPGSFPGIRVRLHGSEGSVEVELSDMLPSGERYRLIQSDGQPGEEFRVTPLDAGEATYAARHMRDFVALVQSPRLNYGDIMPTFDDGARAQTVLSAAVEATQNRMQINAPPPTDSFHPLEML